jgi:hypothetical protein
VLACRGRARAAGDGGALPKRVSGDVRVAQQERRALLLRQTALYSSFLPEALAARPSRQTAAALRSVVTHQAQFSCFSMGPDREKSPTMLPVVPITKWMMDV